MASSKILARLKNATPATVPSSTTDNVRDFFRECCRVVPYVLNLFQLEEVVTSGRFRSKIKDKFRANAHVRDPRAVSALLCKGNEELQLILNQFKQRHHLMTEYADDTREPDLIPIKVTESPFLQQFYASNYTQRK